MPKSGYSDALRKELEAVDTTAKLYVELHTVPRSHVRRRRSQWLEADDHSAFIKPIDGSITLPGTDTVFAQNTTTNGAAITDLDNASPFKVCRIRWSGNENRNTHVSKVTARLEPDQDGISGKDVDAWICQPFAVVQDRGASVRIVPLAEPVRVTAGAAIANVDFSWGGTSWAPMQTLPENTDILGNPTGATPIPITYIFIWAIDAEGNAATNVGWEVNGATNTATLASGTTIEQHTLSLDDPDLGLYADAGATAGVPWIQLTRAENYATTTLAFTGGGDATRIAGTLSPLTNILAKAGYSSTNTIVTLDRATLTGTLVAGDLFQFAGTSTELVVAATTTASGNEIVVTTVSAIGNTIASGTAATIGRGFLLNGAPTNAVTFRVQADTPDDSSLTAQVLADDGSTWVTFTDGQTTDDFTNVSARRGYDMRAIFTPSTDGDFIPTLRFLGVEERAIDDITDVAKVDGGDVKVEPIAYLQASVGELLISAYRDGERDFNSVIERLVSSNHIGTMEVHLYYGSSHLDRADWLHIDTYFVDDIEPGHSDTVTLRCLTVLGDLYGDVPKYDSAAGTRSPYVVANQSLATVWSAILEDQLEVPDRHRGADLTNDLSTNTVSRTIDGEQPIDGKDLLEQIAFLGGGAVISSQGGITFADFFQEAGCLHRFDRANILPLGIRPGFSERVPELFVPYQYDANARQFAKEVYIVHANSLVNLGAPKTRRSRFPDGVAKWIDTEAVAEAAGARIVETMGTGLIWWEFVSTEPHPWLQLGDCVAVETDQFIARDPNAGRALKGQLYGVGRIVYMNPRGTRFGVWIQSYSDISGTPSGVTTSIGEPAIGRLSKDAKVEDTNATTKVNRHVERHEAGDGDAVTFDNDYEDTPIFEWAPVNARIFTSTMTTTLSHFMVVQAENPTPSGFTALAVVKTGISYSAITDGWSTTQNAASPENTTNTMAADGDVLYSNLEDATNTATLYECYYNIDATGMDPANTVTVQLWYNDGAGSTTWTLAATRVHDYTHNLTNQKLSATLALGANYDLRLRIVYALDPDADPLNPKRATVTAKTESTSPAGVEYQKPTGGTEYSMTPAAENQIMWTVREG